MATIVWFRHDLRLGDNPALFEAAARGRVVPVFIRDATAPAGERPGAASKWWLHQALQALAGSLGGLVLKSGDPLLALERLVAETGAGAVYWNDDYTPHARSRDAKIAQQLSAKGIEVSHFNANLLHDPDALTTQSGTAFRMFTPFWKTLQRTDIPVPRPAPQNLILADLPAGDPLADWQLLPSRPNWAAHWPELWTPGETGAEAQLAHFLAHGLKTYAEARDHPALDTVSRLSPYLHFGEISPRRIWHAVRHAAAHHPLFEQDADKFLSELAWRDFNHHIMVHFSGDLAHDNWKPQFDAFPWREDPAALSAWQRGQTGYPLVDAGLRELWATGYMHNRVRMITASFLIKHLRLDWRQGERWFWDTLVDADRANNGANWQWVAGSGADAAPFFRIFNPVAQGRKFDPDGAYIRRWCPELGRLDTQYIHAPFIAPQGALEQAGVRLGDTYPHPLVDHAAARAAALAAYQLVKQAER